MSPISRPAAFAVLTIPVAAFAADTAPAEKKPEAPGAPAPAPEKRSREDVQAALKAAKEIVLKDPEFLKARDNATAVIKAEAVKIDPKFGDLIEKAVKSPATLTPEEKKSLGELGPKLNTNPVVTKAFTDLGKAFETALLKADPSLKPYVTIGTRK